MPFEYHISTEERIVYVTGWGDEYLDEDIMSEIGNHPDYDPAFNVLCDFSGFEKAPPLGEIRKIAQVYRKYKDRIQGNIAVVVAPSDVRKGSILAQLIRFFGIRMEFYGDIESAKKFLISGRSWVK